MVRVVKHRTQEIFDIYMNAVRFFRFIWHFSSTSYVWGVECVRLCKRTLLRFDKLLLSMPVSSKCCILREINCCNFSILIHLRLRDSRWRHGAADHTMSREDIDVMISDTREPDI